VRSSTVIERSISKTETEGLLPTVNQALEDGVLRLPSIEESTAIAKQFPKVLDDQGISSFWTGEVMTCTLTERCFVEALVAEYGATIDARTGKIFRKDVAHTDKGPEKMTFVIGTVPPNLPIIDGPLIGFPTQTDPDLGVVLIREKA